MKVFELQATQNQNLTVKKKKKKYQAHTLDAFEGIGSKRTNQGNLIFISCFDRSLCLIAHSKGLNSFTQATNVY